MELADSLKVERYKYIVDRQKYFTELARDAFASYARFFTALSTGGIVLVSSRTRLELRPEVVTYLIHGVAWLITFLGFVAIAQIAFCLARWYGFRRAERTVDPESPRIRWWWRVFEALYIVAIVVTAIVAWHVVDEIPRLLYPPAS